MPRARLGLTLEHMGKSGRQVVRTLQVDTYLVNIPEDERTKEWIGVLGDSIEFTLSHGESSNEARRNNLRKTD